MATPRKHWFRVADSIGDEDWPDEVVATLIRLMARMNTRWARNGLTAEQSSEIVLSIGDAMAITRRKRSDYALLALRQLEAYVSLTVSKLEASVLIRWPKWPIFQGFASRELPESLPRAAPSARRKTQDADARRKREEHSPSESAHPGGQRWARMFEQESPKPPEGVEGWIQSVLPIIEGEADASFPRGSPSASARNGKIRALLWRYWKRAQADGWQRVQRVNGRMTTNERTKLELQRRRETREREARADAARGSVPALGIGLAADGLRDD